MADAAVYAQLTEIIGDVLMADDLILTPATTAQDVEGWDSFKMIEIIMAIEAHYDIKIPSRQIDSLESVGDLAALIGAKTKSAA